jgi:outer membrane protein assembly factor BamB/mono/diheme cytochrome c family protein
MRSWQNVSSRAWAGAAILALTGALVAGCGGSSSSNPSEQGGGKIDAWMTPNGEIWNHREANSEISSENVGELAVAWTVPITATLENSFLPAAKFGYFASTPVFDGKGHVFFQDADNNVFSVDVETGEELWKDEFNEPNEGPNGVTYNEGRIYGCTSTVCFALEAETGEVIWKSERLPITIKEGEEAFPLAEEAGVPTEIPGITAAGQGINFAPQVSDGKVFVSTSGQITGGEAIALDAETGKVLWKTDETKEPEDRAVGGILGTGGSWNAPAIAPDGTVYYGIGNPYRSDNQAINTPTELLYNDSTIALDPESGKVDWYFQAVPNDFYDWDMQISPIFAEVGGKEMVLDAGKMGEVFEMEAGTGKLIWRTPVGKHNGHNEDGKLALEGEYKPEKYPYKVYPGIYGGVETNMAYSAEDEIAYAATVNSYQERATPEEPLAAGGQEFEESTGDMAAIDVKTGKVLWETELPKVPFGAATISNDLVFTTLYDGTVVAVNRETGEIAWEAKLPGGTNSPLVIERGMVIAINSVPTGSEKPQIVAYRLGATGESGTVPGEEPEESSGEAPEGAEAEPTEGEEPEAEPTESEEGGEPTEEPEAEGGEAAEEGGEEAGGEGEASEAMLTEGKTAFTTNCSSCHTLSEAGTTGHVGPNLDELMPERSLVETQVTNGGSIMPAFGGTLSKSEIEAIAAYVSTVAGTGNNTLGGKSTGGGGGA